MGGSPLNIFVWLAPAQCVVELQLSFVAIFVHVVVCLFVADMHNDAEPIWCWLMVVLHWEQEEGGGDWRRGDWSVYSWCCSVVSQRIDIFIRHASPQASWRLRQTLSQVTINY